MNHILLIGVGPLPCYDSNQLYGFGIRTWQFALPLMAAGHKITLVTCEFGVQRESGVNIKYKGDITSYGDIEHIPLPEPNPRNFNVLLTRIEDIIKTHRPNAIVTAGSTIATNLAASLKTDLPIWMDMFGDLFSEIQAKSPFMKDEQELTHFHQTLSRVLLRGDRFSTVSEMQKGAAVGQLGLMGRLNKFTLGEELVWTIPCAVNGDIATVKRSPIFKGIKTSHSDFIILCSGGFNTWTDVETLFEGIEGAMEKNRRIHCVVTGGAIKGHHESGFNRFRSLISKSPYENRFHLLGWLPTHEMEQITLECDLGINVDLPIYESMLGSRNRMLFWMQCGLPILTTTTTEISFYLTENNLAIGVPPEKPKIITNKLLETAQKPYEAQRLAVKAKNFVYQYFTFEETVQPLITWAKNPLKASDNTERDLRNGQPLQQIDLLWYRWAFSNDGKNQDLTIPIPPRPVIKTRPQGKSWWRRLWGF